MNSRLLPTMPAALFLILAVACTPSAAGDIPPGYCLDVDVRNFPARSGPGAAHWCKNESIRRIMDLSAVGNCAKYADSHGPLHQKKLVELAVDEAKSGRFDQAIDWIAVCQCHDPELEAIVREPSQRKATICWLIAE